MTSQEFLKKWMNDQAPSRRDEFLKDVVEMLKPPDQMIWVESVVSHRDFRPVINCKMGHYNFQVDPPEARKIGTDFLDVAHAAEVDSFLYQFFAAEHEMPMEHVGQLVAMFRHWREKTKTINVPPAGRKQ